MTSIAAIGIALLKGEILTIKTGFNDFGTTNLPRELSRSIEQKFGIVISKMRVSGKTKYKIPCSWFQYRLNKSLPENKDGIKKLKEYIQQQMPKPHEIKTDKEYKLYQQIKMIL